MPSGCSNDRFPKLSLKLTRDQHDIVAESALIYTRTESQNFVTHYSLHQKLYRYTSTCVPNVPTSLPACLPPGPTCIYTQTAEHEEQFTRKQAPWAHRGLDLLNDAAWLCGWRPQMGRKLRTEPALTKGSNLRQGLPGFLSSGCSCFRDVRSAGLHSDQARVRELRVFLLVHDTIWTSKARCTA